MKCNCGTSAAPSETGAHWYACPVVPKCYDCGNRLDMPLETIHHTRGCSNEPKCSECNQFIHDEKCKNSGICMLCGIEDYWHAYTCNLCPKERFFLGKSQKSRTFRIHETQGLQYQEDGHLPRKPEGY